MAKLLTYINNIYVHTNTNMCEWTSMCTNFPVQLDVDIFPFQIFSQKLGTFQILLQQHFPYTGKNTTQFVAVCLYFSV